MADEKLQRLLPLLAQMLGHRPSPATVWRWKNHGVKAGDRRVKLRAVKIGGKLYSTPGDVQQFIDEQNPSVDSGSDADTPDERPTETTDRLETAGLL
jgi:hypothetical protein